jgi:hypothetical protein
MVELSRLQSLTVQFAEKIPDRDKI